VLQKNNMKYLFFFHLLLLSITGFSQKDTTKWARAFPITDYMIELNDSNLVVQVELPEGLQLKEEQLGVIYGVYKKVKEDAVQKGYGRCYLIKGNYYYFTIGNNTSGLELKEGDLLYTMMSKTNIYYGYIPKMASHFISLMNVYDSALYDRYLIFNDWTKEKETKLIDLMIQDIQFTGKYFLDNSPEMNRSIESGDYKGRKTLDVMIGCTTADIHDFFDYILARPRNYAGHSWKISEIFATWITEGAPKVVRE
jgi:hypothetical protein